MPCSVSCAKQPFWASFFVLDVEQLVAMVVTQRFVKGAFFSRRRRWCRAEGGWFLMWGAALKLETKKPHMATTESAPFPETQQCAPNVELSSKTVLRKHLDSLRTEAK